MIREVDNDIGVIETPDKDKIGGENLIKMKTTMISVWMLSARVGHWF